MPSTMYAVTFVCWLEPNRFGLGVVGIVEPGLGGVGDGERD